MNSILFEFIWRLVPPLTALGYAAEIQLGRVYFLEI